jgi:hypothetical protein
MAALSQMRISGDVNMEAREDYDEDEDEDMEEVS